MRWRRSRSLRASYHRFWKGSIVMVQYIAVPMEAAGFCVCSFFQNVLALKTLLLSQQLLKFALGQRNFLRPQKRKHSTITGKLSKCNREVPEILLNFGEGVMFLWFRGTKIEFISEILALFRLAAEHTPLIMDSIKEKSFTINHTYSYQPPRYHGSCFLLPVTCPESLKNSGRSVEFK